ncbi:MAG: hypothetical protein PWP24_1734 [Clostridiales bacterium]|nr:hypothetical protein [Clostridiales bacterium]
MEKKRCNQCKRHCPIDDLHCKRGKKYFEEQGLLEESKNKKQHKEERRNVNRGEKRVIARHGRVKEPESLQEYMQVCSHYVMHHSENRGGQKRIIQLLKEKESMTQKELQEILDIQAGSVSEVISKLEKKGLLTRKKDKEDKRMVMLEITERGRKHAKRKAEYPEKEDMFAALNEEQKVQLMEYLQLLWKDWNKKEDQEIPTQTEDKGQEALHDN